MSRETKAPVTNLIKTFFVRFRSQIQRLNDVMSKQKPVCINRILACCFVAAVAREAKHKYGARNLASCAKYILESCCERFYSPLFAKLSDNCLRCFVCLEAHVEDSRRSTEADLKIWIINWYWTTAAHEKSIATLNFSHLPRRASSDSLHQHHLVMYLKVRRAQFHAREVSLWGC